MIRTDCKVFVIHCTSAISHMSRVGQGGTNSQGLIGTDCEVFVIHCTSATSQKLYKWREHRFPRFEASQVLKRAPLEISTRIKDILHHAGSHSSHQTKHQFMTWKYFVFHTSSLQNHISLQSCKQNKIIFTADQPTFYKNFPIISSVLQGTVLNW